MRVGDRVVGWAEPRTMKTAARMGTANAILQTFVATLTAWLWSMVGRGDDDSLRVVLAAGCSAIMVLVATMMWRIAWLQWRAVNESWGALHAYTDGNAVVLGNPFNLAFGKRRRFPSGSTVAVSVSDGTGRGGALSVWTVAGTGTQITVKAPGPWTEERWNEFCAGLQRLGFTVTAK